MRDHLVSPVERVLGMHRTMCLIREFEERAGQALHAGFVRGSVHQYVGEEAIATGVCVNLRITDYIASYHRGHGHSIAKGVDPTAMAKELLGRAGGICGGKGGSMHIADFSTDPGSIAACTGSLLQAARRHVQSNGNFDHRCRARNAARQLAQPGAGN